MGVLLCLLVEPDGLCGAEQDYSAARRRMITEQLTGPGRDITNALVLRAMQRVPRHEFVPAALKEDAYRDSPLPIGYGQTISQPFIVAFMTQELDPKPQHRVLEVGTGSGYQAAVLAELVGQVYSIEIVPELAKRAIGICSGSAIQTFWCVRATVTRAGRKQPPSIPSSSLAHRRGFPSLS